VASGSATRLGKARADPEVEGAVGLRRGALGAMAIATPRRDDKPTRLALFENNFLQKFALECIKW
jgi:hypothetical protein